MRSIQIDEDVYTYLQREAIAYVETPNMTIRRLLGISEKPAIIGNGGRRNKPKVNLTELVKMGLLEEKQELVFKDYSGRKHTGSTAVISGGMLKYNDEIYSMSKLAKMLLKDLGYKSDQVRGPLFWFTADGKSIKELWDLYLENYDATKN